MPLTVQFDFTTLVATVPSDAFLKSNRNQVVYVVTKNDSAAEALPAGAAVSFKIKPQGQRDLGNIVVPAAMSLVSGTTNKYLITVDAFTDAVLTLLGLGDDVTTNDKIEKTCDGVILYRTSSGTAWEDADESSTFQISLQSAVNLPDDASALSVSGSVFTPRSALTGGAAGALDAIVTLNGAVASGQLALCVVSSVLSVWRFAAGTTAEDSAAGIVRPDDYNASTNAFIWTQIL